MNKRKETIPELFRQLMRVRAVFRQAMLKKLKENNIEMTFEMLQIMHALWLEQGISQQTLAFNTVRDKASLTSLINNLEKKGLVERKSIATDGRSKLIFLSEKGEELSLILKPMVNDVYAHIEKKIGFDATKQAISYMEKVYDELENF
jgi:DNA-binding MarR family transcriptional regulator